MPVNLSLNAIVETLGGLVSGDGNTQITRVGSLDFAETGAIGFFVNRKYLKQLTHTRASAVILKPDCANLTDLPKIITDNPYAYFAKVSLLLNPKSAATSGRHASAVIAETAIVPASCHIGAHVVIAEQVVLGENVIIGAGTVIEQGVSIGDNTVIEANVTIKHHCEIGSDCHLFSGCVIGNDGFGYAEEADINETKRWIKIPQVGRVRIKNHVDIGANTTIDRGAIDDTVIEEGVKLDNLIQIAHNCRIGAHTVIAGCTGIAGSAIIGAHCKIGGAAMILGHLTIADAVTISPGSMITRSIANAGTYTALMPFQTHEEWLKTAVNIRQLDKLNNRIKMLEAAIAAMSTVNKD